MNILRQHSFVLYILTIAGATLCNSYPGLGQKTPADSVRLRPENLKIKSAVKPVSTIHDPASRAASKQDSSESAMAKSLADELKNAGVTINEKDIDDITLAITKGGKAAMELARTIIISITEVEADQRAEKKSPAHTQGVRVSEKQIDDIIQSLGKGKDSTLRLSRYLKLKFAQLKKNR